MPAVGSYQSKNYVEARREAAELIKVSEAALDGFLDPAWRSRVHGSEARIALHVKPFRGTLKVYST